MGCLGARSLRVGDAEILQRGAPEPKSLDVILEPLCRIELLRPLTSWALPDEGRRGALDQLGRYTTAAFRRGALLVSPGTWVSTSRRFARSSALDRKRTSVRTRRRPLGKIRDESIAAAFPFAGRCCRLLPSARPGDPLWGVAVAPTTNWAMRRAHVAAGASGGHLDLPKAAAHPRRIVGVWIGCATLARCGIRCCQPLVSRWRRAKLTPCWSEQARQGSQLIPRIHGSRYVEPGPPRRRRVPGRVVCSLAGPARSGALRLGSSRSSGLRLAPHAAVRGFLR